MKIYIAPHNLASEGSKFLAEKLDATRIIPENSKYKYKNDHLIINWGRSVRPPWWVNDIKVLNDPKNVAVAISKTDTFVKLKNEGVSIPEFTTNIAEAKTWIKNGNMVVCRTKTRASGGDGIVLANTENEVVNAPLYTLYKKKKAEYRVAVVDGVVVDYMQKKKRQDWNVEEKGEINNYVRSHDNGWIFARQGVNPPQSVLDNSIKAVKSLGLDFGSVDVIHNESENKSYVLEVNCAPGLEENGTSLERYSKAFLALVKNEKIIPATPVAEEVIPATIKSITAANKAPVPQANVAQPVTTTPIVQSVPVNIPAKITDYTFQGVTDLLIKQENGVMKIYGRVANVKHSVKIMEIENPTIKFWWGD